MSTNLTQIFYWVKVQKIFDEIFAPFRPQRGHDLRVFDGNLDEIEICCPDY